MARLSVVVATYDADEKLDRCIASFIKTHYGRLPFEIIVSLDGGPNYNKAKVIADRHGARLVKLDENSGCAYANNNGIRAISKESDAVIVVNDDVWFTEDTCARIYTYLKNNPKVGVAGALLLYPDGTTQHAGFDARIEHIGRGLPGDHPLVREDRATIAITSALMGISRKLLDVIKGFDERYRMGYEDVDLCFRARSIGWGIQYLGSTHAFHEEGGTRGRVEKLMANERWGGWNSLGYRVFCSTWSSVQHPFCHDSLSFVISVGDGENPVPTIDNLLSCISQNDEIIVVEQQSSQVCRVSTNGYQRIKFVQSNAGDEADRFDLGTKHAGGCYLTYIRSGNTYADGAIDTIKRAIRAEPLFPHVFRIKENSNEMWEHKKIEDGVFTPQMIVVPNCADFLWAWRNTSKDPNSAKDYLIKTVERWPQGKLIWNNIQIA